MSMTSNYDGLKNVPKDSKNKYNMWSRSNLASAKMMLGQGKMQAAPTANMAPAITHVGRASKIIMGWQDQNSDEAAAKARWLAQQD